MLAKTSLHAPSHIYPFLQTEYCCRSLLCRILRFLDCREDSIACKALTKAALRGNRSPLQVALDQTLVQTRPLIGPPAPRSVLVGIPNQLIFVRNASLHTIHYVFVLPPSPTKTCSSSRNLVSRVPADYHSSQPSSLTSCYQLRFSPDTPHAKLGAVKSL